jgi:hypothetical protein
MSAITHQTVRLSRGKHSSPAQGACVMELASMLAGEPFSDHPVCVSPMIGYLLRAYNDAVDDRRRQRLYSYASKIVSSARPREIEQARAERLREELARRQSRLRRALRHLALDPTMDLIAARLVRRILADDDGVHDEVLRLVDELLEMGREVPAPASAEPVTPRIRPRAAMT